MQFTDQQFGVSFRYPASWTFSLSQPFYMQLAISPAPDVPDRDRLRALIYTTSAAGVASRPDTDFEGLEFGYDAHYVSTPNTCRALAKPEDGDIGPLDEITIKGNRYWHATTSNAGLGHGMSEDIYTMFSNGSCLRFDLAVSRSEGGVVLRALTASEQSQLHASLLGVLNSVLVAPPAR